MKKIIFSLLIILGFGVNTNLHAQMDFGISLGGANYLGEIGGSGEEPKPWLLDMKLGQTNFALGGFYRYQFGKSFAAKLSVNYARISGADSVSSIASARGRNLSFRTDIVEMILTGEYHFIVMNDLNRSSRNKVNFNAYVLAGAGVAFYYPHAQYNDNWYYLRPLQTEGTENAYDEMTVVVPLGIGAAFTFNNKIRLGLEFGYRFTFTDYLDDVSTDYAYNPNEPEFDQEVPFEESKIFANRTNEAYASGSISEAEVPRKTYDYGGVRGNPESDDGYLIGQISLSFVIGGRNSFYKSRYNSIINRRRKRTKF